MKHKKFFTMCIAVLTVVLGVTGVASADSFPPLPEALAALESDDEVTVRTERLPLSIVNAACYVFEPNDTEPSIGFVFYPGGKVDPRAYAPPLHALAAEGYLTAIVSMPFDLAPFGPNRANKFLQKYDGIEKWVIGGHSVGGAYACKYAQSFTEKVEGVAIWASFPTESFRLDDTDLRVVCIYATNNPNCNADEIEANKPFLPSDTVYVEIEGGNHTQFGYYDTSPDPVQPEDGIATITREEQQAIIIQSTLDLLDQL